MVEVVVEAARSQLHGTLNNDVKFHGLQTGTLGEFVWVLQSFMFHTVHGNLWRCFGFIVITKPGRMQLS